MWTSTWALNSLVTKGKSADWMVHMLGQSVGAVTDAAHGMTLAAVSLPYYRHIMPYGIEKFARFATNVWGIDASEKTALQLANEGLASMESWMKEIGVVMKLADLGANEAMIDDIVKGSLILEGGYKILNKDEIAEIIKESMGK
jgi:alcohol dehydrogenase YqhD (iron-dependent ADH family)